MNAWLGFKFLLFLRLCLSVLEPLLGPLCLVPSFFRHLLFLLLFGLSLLFLRLLLLADVFVLFCLASFLSMLLLLRFLVLFVLVNMALIISAALLVCVEVLVEEVVDLVGPVPSSLLPLATLLFHLATFVCLSLLRLTAPGLATPRLNLLCFAVRRRRLLLALLLLCKCILGDAFVFAQSRYHIEVCAG